MFAFNEFCCLSLFVVCLSFSCVVGTCAFFWGFRLGFWFAFRFVRLAGGLKLWFLGGSEFWLLVLCLL